MSATRPRQPMPEGLRSRATAIALALACAACAASNPERGSLQPVRATDVPPAEPKTAAAASPAAAPAAAAPAAAAGAPGAVPQVEQPAAAAPASKETPADEVAASLLVGRVGDKLLDVRTFLARLWMRDPAQAREILEHLVFAELAMLEGDRLGLRVEPAAVDEMLARAMSEIERKLATAGSKLTPQEHIEKRLGVDFDFYQAQLRHDAIVQLLAERAVRAFVLESPRMRVRVMDLPDEETLALVQARLMEGGDFEQLAREHGLEAARATGGAVLELVRSEDHPLARLAFATPIGSIAGPVAEGGRFLLIKPEERLEPLPGTGSSLRGEVEESLAQRKVDDLEYVQWRAAMVRRYRVDLEPFLELVGASAP